MKRYNQLLVSLSAVTTALLLHSACAQEQSFYIKGALGPAINQDVDVKNFLGVSNPGKFEFDPGVRFDFGVGYNFNRWIAAEFESGVIYNGIRHQEDSSLSSIPLMVNAVVNVPINNSRLVPFLGAGVGGVVSVLDAHDLSDPRFSSDAFVHGSDSDLVFAWQGFAGLRYNVSDKFDVNIAYKYLWTDGPSWEAEFGHHGPTETIDFGHVENHAVVLGVTFRF